MDYRSMELSHEINAYIYNSDIATENREIFLQDLKVCREIKLGDWKKRPWYRKAVETFVRLFAPLL